MIFFALATIAVTSPMEERVWATLKERVWATLKKRVWATLEERVWATRKTPLLRRCLSLLAH